MLRRLSLLFLLVPWRFIETSDTFRYLSIWEYNHEVYEWTSDPWGGALDIVRRPEEVLETGEGDCDDYALLAACVLASRGYEDLSLAVCFEGFSPTHVVLYDGEHVYSSGAVYEGMSPSEYVEKTDYDRVLTRSIPPRWK